MDCTLFIPNLIPSTEHGERPWHAPEAHRLKTLLARATHSSDTALDAEAWLCNAFGVARQHDWPLAPIVAVADGLPAQTGYWLRATPVHLEPRRTALVLTDPTVPGTTAADSEALAKTLAAHLREEGITLHATRPGCWYLSLPQTPAMRTFALETALHRDVRELLPQGADCMRWHRIITEMQMLLHSHPINEAREARGAPAINSVWISSGGTLPPAGHAQFTAVLSDDDVVRALARHSGCRVADRSNVFDQLSAPGHLLITIESLIPAVTGGNADAWRDAVHALEHEWILPLMETQKSRRIGLTLVSANREGVQRFALRLIDMMKLWCKNKYL
jgi:hypothetical protein